MILQFLSLCIWTCYMDMLDLTLPGFSCSIAALLQISNNGVWHAKYYQHAYHVIIIPDHFNRGQRKFSESK